ncbi:MAG: HTH domain-containing protein [Candidatus Hodarchaeota archaeon]
MRKILPYIKAKFAKSSINISTEGIQKIIISLVKKNIIVEGTKFTKKDVLIYPRRKKIYNYIKENPGKYVNKIAKDLKICNIVVFWHLNVLLKFNFLKKKIIDNHVVYFDSNIDLKDSKKLYLTSKEKCKKIINYLKINDFGITKNQLSRDLKIHRNTIRKYLESLEEINILCKEKRSNKILYFFEED